MSSQPHDDTVSLASSSSLSSAECPPSPTKRRRPHPLRLDHVGVDPSDLVGKRIHRIHLSSAHPVLTLDFTDRSSFQVLVDGYDPRGIPKRLEMDPLMEELLSQDLFHDLMIVDCALITLSDKAFERKQSSGQARPKDVSWDQNHLGVAFKFSEYGADRWHCVWATLEEKDSDLFCTFRSYEDVYLDKLERSPRKQKRRSTFASSSPTKNWS